MANIQKIFTGMSQGPEMIDNNFNAINTELQNVDGVVDSLHWSDGSQEGIVVTDNRVTLNKESQYSYLDIGGKRLVYLHVVLDVKQEIPNVNSQMLFSIPTEIATTGSLRGAASTEAMWVNLAGTNFYVWQNSGISKISLGQLFFTATYLRQVRP